ncbi:MAG: hypothetical protein HOG03_15820 [Desulfobacula sp.]|jgi:protein-tyrosine phosphatase|uniref:arsenate reductase/protein-tyrosine-phosphatase family protein n=1 Tax=Desulfobacula sp. TaxID=2593537 RepID=UPI001D89ECF0|nr:hypothetical protein [Desulfobacula sp.]MBT4026447.1 hypothetical protein [Desulfobacula sp.]MBT4200324.1 hypothetical protein [Desulfobacula sp.]MBT4508469.1 hypothetical protein [Desulfobacula sp.]MBT4877936.1 hypothetical protein [Desulfobacula sp.]
MNIIREILKKIIKQYPKDLYWKFHGKSLLNKQFPDHVTSLHFVCKGNICRSAFAHLLSLKLFNDLEGNRFSISSSGLAVNQPEASPRDAIKIAAEHFNVSLEMHESVPITEEICDREDIIIVMEGWQLSAVQKKFPDCKNKYYLLAQFELNSNERRAGYERYNIPDPYGKGEKAFLKCFSRIERCLVELKKMC